MTDYNSALGEGLRDARKKNNMSLMAVEMLTNGIFKASVLGAYERGERSVTVERFHTLCFIYRTHPIDVLPMDFFPKTKNNPWNVE